MNYENEFFEIECFGEMEELDPRAIQDSVNATGGRMRISTVLDSVGSTSDPGDIASDYADALYFGEKLGEIFGTITLSYQTKFHKSYVVFDVIAEDPDNQCVQLAILVNDFFNWEIPDDKGEDYSDFLDSLYWQDSKNGYRFPELADSYMANLLHGYWPWEDEDVLKTYKHKFPEVSHTFWRSFKGRQLGIEVYCSPDAWVAPPNLNLSQLLTDFGYWPGDNFNRLNKAEVLKFKKLKSLLVTDSNAIKLPLVELSRATKFSEIFMKSRGSETKEWEISASGDLAVFRNQWASHAFFSRSYCLNDEERSVYASTATEQYLRTSNAIGFSIGPPLDWSLLDDEKFEELCYHVAIRSRLLDPTTMRKMGLSRSRDGGRDITGSSYPRPGNTPKNWMIQCKYSRGSTSLSGSKVNISDTIDQFGFGGICIMTNLVIDSTLYDKIDAIARNRGIEHEEWNGLKFEQFLLRHPDLMNRYFS